MSTSNTVILPAGFITVLSYNSFVTIPEKLKRLGSLIRTARKSKGWTLKYLHQVTDLSLTYLSDIERGYINPERGPVIPSDETLRILSAKLGVSIADLHAALGRNEDLVYAADPRFQVIREAFEGGGDTERDYLASTATLLRRAQDAARAGAIGQRKEDGE